jgi:hypothetical protein
LRNVAFKRESPEGDKHLRSDFNNDTFENSINQDESFLDLYPASVVEEEAVLKYGDIIQMLNLDFETIAEDNLFGLIDSGDAQLEIEILESVILFSCNIRPAKN